ncbi:MAG: hypothetical protein RL021_555, partial [Bacteroidota bacterium]
MGNRFIRLLLNGVGVIIGVATILFFLFDLLPADPARMLLGQRSDSASVAIIRRDLGTDLPTGIRFLKYMNDLSPVSVYSDDSTAAFRSDLTGHSHILLLRSGNWRTVLKFPYLRRSYQSKRDVAGLLAERLPDTAVLAISAMLIAVLLGIILGVLAALFKDFWIDRLC